MKYTIRMLTLTVLSLFVSLSAVFAMPATKASLMDESFDLSSIHSIAVAAPNYIQTKTGPAPDAVTALIAQTGFDSRDLKNITIIPYSVIAENMKNESGIDLQTSDRNTAKKLFKENAAKYADAYLVVTIANDSRVVLFYDLYSSKTSSYLYSYRVIGGGQGDNNINSYKSFNELFYKGLSDSIKEQHKDDSKTKK
ncbi:hypothetical protein [Pectinatus haikarae]|uniref:hypothetical protein n=1 Tax=Pectinatus haikarae TaxID=349096 RepID=UPI0018C604DD|nr:hypothetical protein [Pectinatus haikarae]